MSQLDVGKHVTLRSQMFRYGASHGDYNVSQKLELLICDVYACLVHEGDVVVDIGAHVGFHARKLSDLVGRKGTVLAIEPNKELANRFWRYVGARKNVQLIHEVLSDRPADTFFYRVSGQKSSRSSIHLWDETIPPSAFMKEPVRTNTLDNIFRYQDLRFIKIDAEGADLDILAGSKETVRRLRPYIVLEWNKTSFQVHGHSSTDLRELAVGLDYQIFSTFGDDLTDSAVYQTYSEKFGDMFLVPRELKDEFTLSTRSAIEKTLSAYEAEVAGNSG